MKTAILYPMAALACASMLPGTGYAQTGAAGYPAKPVRVIVAFPPGSGVDLVTRVVIPKLGESMGRQFVIDNRGGAGGILGTEIASKSPADGYTLFATSPAVVVTALTGKVAYSPRDFAAISRMASVPFMLVVHPSLPVKSTAELVKLARAQPRTINYASTGNWTGPHLTTELFRRAAKIEITHVPYKGSAPALTDLLGGHIEMFFCNMLSAVPHVASGRLRALAVTSLQRAPVTPQVPTVAESGYPQFESGTWFGLLAPAATPEDIVALLYAETGKVLRRADVQAQLASQGASATLDKGPRDFPDFMQAETDKWGRVIKAMGVKVE